MVRDDLHPSPPPRQQARPPADATASRPRARRNKTGAKKQPQRGLGVAQLEKLRLEEQSKQQEAAACLAAASLHHRQHRLSAPPLPPDALVLVAAEQQSQTVPLHHYLSRCTKGGGGGGGGLHVISAACNRGSRSDPMMCVRDQIPFPVPPDFDGGRERHCGGRNLPVAKLNAQSFIPMVVPGMSSVAPGSNFDRSLPLGMANAQHGAEENEARRLSSMSPPPQHGLHSSTLALSSTAIPSISEKSISKMPPHSDTGKTFAIISESSLQAMDTHPDCPIFITKALTGKGPPTGVWAMRFQDTASKSEVPWGKAKEPPAFFSVAAASKEKAGQDIIAGQEQDAAQNRTSPLPNRTSPLPFMDLRLFQPVSGSNISINQPRNHELESPSPEVTVSSTALELSSFQTFPSNQAWSFGDQISGRKRQWVLTQEPTRNFEELKGAYIHMAAAKDVFEPKLRDDPDTGLLRGSEAVTVAGTYRRNAVGNSTASSVKVTGSFSTTVKENTENLLLLSRFSPEFVSFPETVPLKVCTVSSSRQMDCFTSAASNGCSLPDTRTQCMDFVVSSKNIEARISNDFLSLGLSTYSSPSVPVEPTAVKTGHVRHFSTSDVNKTKDNLLRSPPCTQQQGESLGKFLGMLPTTAPNSSDRDEQHSGCRGPSSSILLSIGLPSLACGSESEHVEQQQLMQLPSTSGNSCVDLELKLCL